MLDITLALIFSQLPHPECWMPRLPLEALNCFWLACLLGSWCSLGFRVYVVVDFVWRRSCYLCICVIGLSQHRFQCTVNYVWHCGHFTVCTGLPQFLLYSTVFPPRGSNLNGIQHTDRFLSQMWCVQNRESRLLLFSSSLFLFFFGTQHLLLCCLVFFTLFLFPNLTPISFSHSVFGGF